VIGYALLIATVTAVVGLLLSGERSARVIALGAALALVATVAVGELAATRTSFATGFLLGGAVAWSMTDYRTGYIRNALMIPLAIVLITLGCIENGWLATIIGALTCGGVFAVFRFVQWGSVGGGDVLAATCVGAALGAPAGPLGISIGLAVALLAALLTCGPNMMRMYRLRIRMGPYMAAGALAAILLPSLPFALR
jgi:hypothetical protein